MSSSNNDWQLIGGVRSYANTWDIGPELYQMKFVQRLPDRATGMCDASTNSCYSILKQSKIETFRTFIHEMIHAMEDVYDFELKHEYVEKLEIAFADFLLENRYSLADILFPKKNPE